MGGKLASLGVSSCGDLQQVSMARLQREFGPRTGQTLFRFCRGLDDRPVRPEKERKSVSAEMNYNIRFTKVTANVNQPINQSISTLSYYVCALCMYTYRYAHTTSAPSSVTSSVICLFMLVMDGQQHLLQQDHCPSINQSTNDHTTISASPSSLPDGLMYFTFHYFYWTS